MELFQSIKIPHCTQYVLAQCFHCYCPVINKQFLLLSPIYIDKILGAVLGVLAFVAVIIAVAVLILLTIWCKWTGRFKSWKVWENLSTFTRSRHPNRDGPSREGGMKISISQPIIDDSNLSDPGYRNTFAIATSTQYKTISSTLEENELENQGPNCEKSVNNSPKHAQMGDPPPHQPTEFMYTSEYARVSFTSYLGEKEDIESGYSDPKELGISKEGVDETMPRTNSVSDPLHIDQDYGEPIELGMIFKPVQTPNMPPSPDQASVNSSDDDFWGTR